MPLEFCLLVDGAGLLAATSAGRQVDAHMRRNGSPYGQSSGRHLTLKPETVKFIDELSSCKACGAAAPAELRLRSPPPSPRGGAQQNAVLEQRAPIPTLFTGHHSLSCHPPIPASRSPRKLSIDRIDPCCFKAAALVMAAAEEPEPQWPACLGTQDLQIKVRRGRAKRRSGAPRAHATDACGV
eukprot:365482-Chlamydomonas_euryale.AAC.7